MKTCTKCGIEKPLTEFYKQSRSPSGLAYCCKACAIAKDKDWGKKNPERRKKNLSSQHYKRTYGITPEEKTNLIAGQQGRCASCGDEFSSVRHTHVDHVHGSDPVVVRGILCSQCNIGLGNFKDSTERLANAITYLKKFQVST